MLLWAAPTGFSLWVVWIALLAEASRAAARRVAQAFSRPLRVGLAVVGTALAALAFGHRIDPNIGEIEAIVGLDPRHYACTIIFLYVPWSAALRRSPPNVP